jgi:uncharacterized membrane protein YfcA
MDIFVMVLVSVIGGVVGGMGMGGGTLLIPLLTVFTAVSQHLAQSMNLLAFIPMSVIAIFLHVKNKLIKFPYLLLSIPALISSIFASIFASATSAVFLRKGFGIFLAVLGIINLFTMLLKKMLEKEN